MAYIEVYLFQERNNAACRSNWDLISAMRDSACTACCNRRVKLPGFAKDLHGKRALCVCVCVCAVCVCVASVAQSDATGVARKSPAAWEIESERERGRGTKVIAKKAH